MFDSEHNLIKKAYQHADNCYAEAEAIADYLQQATDELQGEEPKLREAIAQLLIKAEELVDHCGEVANELSELRLKYRAAHSTTGLPPEVETIQEVLASIQHRKRSSNHTQE